MKNEASFQMTKVMEQWILFQYINGQCAPLSKPFKTKKEAQAVREKYPAKQRKRIGLGVIRTQA